VLQVRDEGMAVGVKVRELTQVVLVLEEVGLLPLGFFFGRSGGLDPLLPCVAGEKFDRIVDYELGEKPESVPLQQAMGYTDDEIPF
jgi:hypothetical protein